MARNENCLEGFCCPECGNTDRFTITGQADFEVEDDGTWDFGDVEWGNHSRCICPCGNKGVVRDFQAIEHTRKLPSKPFSKIAAGALSYVFVQPHEDFRVRDRVVLRPVRPASNKSKKPPVETKVFMVSDVSNDTVYQAPHGKVKIVSLVPWDGLANSW